MKLTGHYVLRVRDENGGIVREEAGENLVVVDGYELAAGLIAGEALTAISHMAAGNSDAEPDEDQSDLVGTEQARVTVTTSRANHVITYTADFSSIGADVTVAEFGLFNDATAGTMLARFIIESFTLFAGQSMDIEWSIRVGQ